jgi:hypothetical protein
MFVHGIACPGVAVVIEWIVEESGTSGVEAMPKEDEFEQRLAAIERAVAEIQRRLANMPDSQVGLQKLIGSITDIEAFEQVLKYGREFRYSDRPSDQDIDLGSSLRS